MILNADVLTFQEFVMHEPLPLSKIQGAVLEFLQGRDDTVLFGAQAVNAYVREPRATQDVDILSPRAGELADELRVFLSDRFHMAIRVREVGDGKGYRIYQVRKEGNRHLVHVRLQSVTPASRVVEGIQVLTPAELIVSKVLSYVSRRGNPKSGTDWRDLAMLLVSYPDLKKGDGVIGDMLAERGAGQQATEFWAELADQEISSAGEDDDLNY
jgi:hypothetical protein